MPSKQTIEIERMLSDGVDCATITKTFNISRQRVRQIKSKLFDSVKRCEQRLENDVDDALSHLGAKAAGNFGGYLHEKKGKGYKKDNPEVTSTKLP